MEPIDSPPCIFSIDMLTCTDESAYHPIRTDSAEADLLLSFHDGAARKLLVAPVTTPYPLRDGIEVLPLLEAVRQLAR